MASFSVTSSKAQLTPALRSGTLRMATVSCERRSTQQGAPPTRARIGQHSPHPPDHAPAPRATSRTRCWAGPAPGHTCSAPRQSRVGLRRLDRPPRGSICVGSGQSPSRIRPGRALSRAPWGPRGERAQPAQPTVPGNSVPQPCPLGSKGRHSEWRFRSLVGESGTGGRVGAARAQRGEASAWARAGAAPTGPQEARPAPPKSRASVSPSPPPSPSWAPYLCCSTHQPQCGSPEPKQAAQLRYCSQVSTGSWLTWGQPRQHPPRPHTATRLLPPRAHLLLTQEVDVPVVGAEEQVSENTAAIHHGHRLVQVGILGAINSHLGRKAREEG